MLMKSKRWDRQNRKNKKKDNNKKYPNKTTPKIINNQPSPHLNLPMWKRQQKETTKIKVMK